MPAFIHSILQFDREALPCWQMHLLDNAIAIPRSRFNETNRGFIRVLWVTFNSQRRIGLSPCGVRVKYIPRVLFTARSRYTIM